MLFYIYCFTSCLKKSNMLLALSVLSILPLNRSLPGPKPYVFTSSPVCPFVVQPVCDLSFIGFELHLVIFGIALHILYLPHHISSMLHFIFNLTDLRVRNFKAIAVINYLLWIFTFCYFFSHI